MPRPVKCRKVCHFPNVLEFLPADDAEKKTPIVLTVDEYETIRLLDKKGYSQEQCAESMQIARTTVQRIYEIARKKIADALIDGHPLRIEGGDLKCSRNKPTPRWMSSKWFRYGFLIFFLTMFGNMVFQTYLVGAGASSLREAIKLFWTFRVPWGWTYTAGTVADWVAQFSFGFYSLMLTSLLLGLIVMVLYKPRTWCTFCPMGTMTQGICKLKNNEKK